MDAPADLLGALRQTLSELSSGAPRRSENLETTLEAAERAVRAGAVDEGRAAVRAQRERLEAACHDLESHVRDVPMEGTAAALVQRMRDLYEVNRAALDALEEAVAAGDAAGVEQASARLRDITADMFACSDAVDAEMKSLERLDGGVVMVPESYAQLYEACDRLARGQIAISAWQHVLDGVEQEVRSLHDRIDAGLAGMAGALREDAYAQGIAAEVQMGVLETLKGLERMRTYPATAAVRDLNEGWNGMVAGNVRVQKAMRRLLAGQGAASDEVILEDE